MNSCNFVGNLVNEPMYFDGQVPRAVFTLAVDHNRKSADGQRKAEFLDFVAWHGVAEFVHRYCHKGDAISVQNCMAKRRKIEADDGTVTYRTEFQVDNVELVRRAKANMEEGN
ncbi:MAG: single-stranded DNA-binding protein [Oscillospiraceae bacterium]|nr:single-stranded DNA-binding protein [Oscillospiraceae bacterium]